MWYLSFIPDIWLTYAVHAVTILGLIGVIVGFLGSKIPFVSHYGGIVKGISTIVLLIGIYFEGSITNEMMWRSKIADLEKKVDIAKQESKKANERLDKEVSEKLKGIKDNFNVNKQEIEKNRESIDAECKLSDTAWLLYNRASQNAISGSTNKSVTTSK
jgi:hypothetical protein